MNMKLVYFSWVKDRIGMAEETVELPDEVKTVADLLAWMPGRGANFADALADPAIIRVAVDQEYATPDADVTGASEIALFPPVTGG
jgi:molybdopterin synthase sulfur carrier subunit|tara:strand:- start:2002 stop:2259 length:258 start_codon:yes stop_codon:yes gene_type:complete